MDARFSYKTSISDSGIWITLRLGLIVREKDDSRLDKTKGKKIISAYPFVYR